jgi:flagellar basal-body rod modification protein FlgD
MQITAANNNPVNPTLGNDKIESSKELLGQEDFIRLLVSQMTSQDPLNPMSNQDMLAQMVQFSTLQQNTGLQAELARMQTTQSLTQANAMLGRQVTLLTESGVVEGIVSGVSIEDGGAKVVVNETAYNLDQVMSITTPPNPQP